jgi:hypothetical protein
VSFVSPTITNFKSCLLVATFSSSGWVTNPKSLEALEY